MVGGAERSLRRVNVGVKAWQDNLTGRNDELYTDISFGYTQKFVLGYTLPYIDRKLRHGIGFSASFSRNRKSIICLLTISRSFSGKMTSCGGKWRSG